MKSPLIIRLDRNRDAKVMGFLFGFEVHTGKLKSSTIKLEI